jgi:hypothetical protein
MAEFKSFAPGVEVLGEVIVAFMKGFPAGTEKKGSGTLEKHGIKDPVLGGWYPLQPFLDAMQELSTIFGSSFLGRIGEQIATNAKLPPDLDSMEKCLESIDIAYHMNHRGGDIGHYGYSFEGVQGGLKRAKIICQNPYPCAFDRGCIEGFAVRFSPQGPNGVTVRQDDDQPCRRQGAESCTFVISWL